MMRSVHKFSKNNSNRALMSDACRVSATTLNIFAVLDNYGKDSVLFSNCVILVYYTLHWVSSYWR